MTGSVQVAPIAIEVGAVVSFPGYWLRVVAVGLREHSRGYGPVSLVVECIDGTELAESTIVNTPWGYAEVCRSERHKLHVKPRVSEKQPLLDH
jgi:hypothetical protein